MHTTAQCKFGKDTTPEYFSFDHEDQYLVIPCLSFTMAGFCYLRLSSPVVKQPRNSIDV